MYQIRECKAEDSGFIYELNRDWMGYDYPPDKTREKLCELMARRENKILVAEESGRVVGYIHAASYDTTYSPHMKNIMGIAVSSGFQRQGIGRALLAHVEEWARQDGAAGVRLVSGSARTGAHVFYQSCGYEGDKMQLNLKKIF
ncbi:MAG: GNAT family N-acetyltransferase [Lachnospiraceae bacterium]|nr:GNAT family N-acetyltransferase [Lachnospiraceae bacterium]